MSLLKSQLLNLQYQKINLITMSYKGAITTFILLVIVGGYPTYLLVSVLIPSLLANFHFPLFCYSLGLSFWVLFFISAFITTFLSERHINWLLKNGIKVKAKLTEVIEHDMGDNDFEYYIICQAELHNKTHLQFKSKCLKYNPTDYCNEIFNGKVDVY